MKVGKWESRKVGESSESRKSRKVGNQGSRKQEVGCRKQEGGSRKIGKQESRKVRKQESR